MFHKLYSKLLSTMLKLCAKILKLSCLVFKHSWRYHTSEYSGNYSRYRVCIRCHKAEIRDKRTDTWYPLKLRDTKGRVK